MAIVVIVVVVILPLKGDYQNNLIWVQGDITLLALSAHCPFI